MHDTERDDYLVLLAQHRHTLAHEQQRAARYGGEAAAPPEIQRTLAEARAAIAQLKVSLRAAGVAVDDLPGDLAPPAEPHRLDASAITSSKPLLDNVPGRFTA